MLFKKDAKKFSLLIVVQLVFIILFAQPGVPITKWTADGGSYYTVEKKEIVKIELPSQNKTIFISRKQLITKNGDTVVPRSFQLSTDGKLALIYTNAQKVWRYTTRGDYWLLNLTTGDLKQMGKGRATATLQFAKFSPDNKKVAYVSERNIYSEDLSTGVIKKLTSDNGTKKLINGTFDWVYEEEFSCRDGFRWSPDSRSIAYWQIDASQIRNFLMIDNTDSLYSFTIPVEYPKAGEDPSPCKVGVVSLATGATTWMNVPGDSRQHYIPRMEWAPGSSELILEQLNRKQNDAAIFLCQAATGQSRMIYEETDKAWIDVKGRWSDDPTGWEWINGGKEFLWVSEKDGWRNIYRIRRDGTKETLLTKGNYDMISMRSIDEARGAVYFMASPDNATQQYLYRADLAGKGKLELVSP